MSNPRALKSLFTELYESPGPFLWATQGPAPPRKCADLIFVPRVPSTEPAAGLQGGGKGRGQVGGGAGMRGFVDRKVK